MGGSPTSLVQMSSPNRSTSDAVMFIMTSFHRSPANFRSHWIPSPHPDLTPDPPPPLHSYPLPLQVKGGHLLGRWGEILIPPHSTLEAVGQNGIDAKQRGKHASITHKALATIFEHT